MALIPLDYSAIRNVAVPDVVGVLSRGLQFGEQFQQARQQRGLAHLLGKQGVIDAEGKFNPQAAYSAIDQNYSGGLAGLLRQSVMTTQQAQQKALLDAQKTQADILQSGAEVRNKDASTNKYIAEVPKIEAETTGLAQKNGKELNQSIAQQLASAPNRNAALSILQDMWRNNQIDGGTLTSWAGRIMPATDDTFPALQDSFALMATDDPAKYRIEDANSKAGNATSTANSIRTTNATLSGQRNSFNIANLDRKQQYQLQTGKGQYVEGADGKGYIQSWDGSLTPAMGANGQQIFKDPALRPLSAAVQKEIFETDDAITSGNAVIAGLNDALRLNGAKSTYDGVGALNRAQLVGNLKNSPEARNTVELNNIVTGNALNALKTTFGAAPTEGERKILLELQGSVNLPAAQREAIYKRAITAAENRLTVNQQKAAGLRNGTYLKPDGTAAPTANDQPAQLPQTATLAQAQAAAKKAGISTTEMVNLMRSSGITVK